MKKYILCALASCLLLYGGCEIAPRRPALESGDWPQYRADAGRTGYTPAELPESLSLKWKRVQPAPSPAWKGVHTRMTFDYAYQPVIGGKTLFYGSSTDCKVYAVDTDTGRERWSFFTKAPVRFAPVLWKDRVFAVSDDGFLYCLKAQNGKELWRTNGGPDGNMILGNDRMISKWPARGGIVIKNDVLYFGAGIWPTEGIFIYALNPETGEEIWVNDDSGGMEYDQPHGGARAKSGVSSQGYLVAAGEHLYVPTGRSIPAAFDIRNGAFKYFHLQKYRTYGGSRVAATDSYLFATSGNTRFEWETIGKHNAVFNTADGELVTPDEFNSPALAISPEYVFYVDSRDLNLKALDHEEFITDTKVRDRKGEMVTQKNISPPSWSVNTREPEAVSMIAAGNKIVTGSVNHKITVIDGATKSVVWSEDVDGVPYGLAAAHGRLYVSTDRGTIYCFDGTGTKSPRTVTGEPNNFPYGDNDIYARAAEEIIEKTGITDGYCLDVACGEGQLAWELARRTNLSIIAIDSDPETVAKARKKLDNAGLYGSRVTVHCGDVARTPYPDYCANLVVSGRSVTGGQEVLNTDEFARLQRPCGGVLCIGEPGSMETHIRGKLTGSGDWTHLYGNPANTINSGDELVKGPLGILWFRDSDYEMPSRHGRGVGPLYSDGRLFVQGTHGIRAYDAYNGTVLWEYYIEDLMKDYDQEHLLGAATTAGNWCIEGNRLYVRVSRQAASDTYRNCLVFDVETGNLVNRFMVPPGPKGDERGHWGYLAVEDGTIYGTIVDNEHITTWGYLESDMSGLYSESKALFAMDAETGELKWMYRADHSIRHNTIALGNGSIYLIDRPIATGDHLFQSSRRGIGTQDAGTGNRPGKLVAIDTETGEVRGISSNNIYGTLLALSTENDVLVMTCQFTRFRLPSERGGRMTGFRASDLTQLWDVPTGIGADNPYSYSSRPIINGGTIYFEPYAFDLMTGGKRDFVMSRTYNCGIITGSKNMLCYRSGTVGYLDLTAPDGGTLNFGGIRPGCWINTVPAGGLVLMPDATARCNCSYLIKATIALQPL